LPSQDWAVKNISAFFCLFEYRLLTLPTSVVICSVEADSEIVEAARQAEALAYVLKTRIETDLISAVKSAVQGKFFVPPGSH